MYKHEAETVIPAYSACWCTSNTVVDTEAKNLKSLTKGKLLFYCILVKSTENVKILKSKEALNKIKGKKESNLTNVIELNLAKDNKSVSLDIKYSF